MSKMIEDDLDKKIKDSFKQLDRYDQILSIGYMTWILWCEKLHLPMPDPNTTAGWTEPVFLLVGLVSNGYLAVYLPMSSWWQDLQIRWLFWVLKLSFF